MARTQPALAHEFFGARVWLMGAQGLLHLCGSAGTMDAATFHVWPWPVDNQGRATESTPRVGALLYTGSMTRGCKEILVLAVAVFLAGCTEAEAPALALDAGSPVDAGQTVEPRASREVVATTIVRACVGCQDVSVCGSAPQSEQTLLELSAYLHGAPVTVFATERLEAAGRALEIGACQVLEGAALAAIVDAPAGPDCLDGGEIALSGAMSLLEVPFAASYSDFVDNYSTELRGERPGQSYTAGVDLNLIAAGGAEVSGFTLQHPAPEPLEITSPRMSEQGKVDNIATDAPLLVSWSGGVDFDDVVITLFGEYCAAGRSVLVLCHAANTGAFTVGTDTLSQVTWPNLVTLRLLGSAAVPVPAPELGADAAWTVRAAADVYVYRDDAAQPPALTCSSDQMREGFAGDACETDGACGGGCCIASMGEHFPGGYCSLPDCETDLDCPADAACIENRNPAVNVGRYCAQRCTSSDECRTPDYDCLEFGQQTVCRPARNGA